MYKVIILLLALSLPSFASDLDDNFEFSAGIGEQYGGVLGGKFSYKTEYAKYFGSLGLIGFGAGFETIFNQDSKHSFGLVAGQEVLRSEDGFVFATYSYHVNGFHQQGMVFSFGVGITRQDEIGLLGDYGRNRVFHEFDVKHWIQVLISC